MVSFLPDYDLNKWTAFRALNHDLILIFPLDLCSFVVLLRIVQQCDIACAFVSAVCMHVEVGAGNWCVFVFAEVFPIKII